MIDDDFTEPGVQVIYEDTNRLELGSVKQEKGKPYHFIRCRNIVHFSGKQELLAEGAFINDTDLDYLEKIIRTLRKIALAESRTLLCRIMIEDSPTLALYLYWHGFRPQGPETQLDNVYEKEFAPDEQLQVDLFAKVRKSGISVVES